MSEATVVLLGWRSLVTSNVLLGWKTLVTSSVLPGRSPLVTPMSYMNGGHSDIERSDSGVELRTLDYENPGSNPGGSVKTSGKFFHSTLLQFTQLNK